MRLRGAAAFYLAATIAALAGVAMRRDFPTRLFHWLVGAGLTLHIVSLVTRETLVGHLPALHQLPRQTRGRLSSG